MEGFGLYLVKREDRQKEASKKGIPIVGWGDAGFPQDLENAAFVRRAKSHFLSECSRFFSEEVSAVNRAVDLLHTRLRHTAELMDEGLTCAYALSSLRACAVDYGSLNGYMKRSRTNREQAQAEVERLETVKTNWIRYKSKEFPLFGLFRARRRHRRQALLA